MTRAVRSRMTLAWPKPLLLTRLRTQSITFLPGSRNSGGKNQHRHQGLQRTVSARNSKIASGDGGRFLPFIPARRPISDEMPEIG